MCIRIYDMCIYIHMYVCIHILTKIKNACKVLGMVMAHCKIVNIQQYTFQSFFLFSPVTWGHHINIWAATIQCKISLFSKTFI